MRTAGASLPGRLGASLLAVILCALMVMPAQAITSNTHFIPVVPVAEKTAYTGVFEGGAQAYTGLFRWHKCGRLYLEVERLGGLRTGAA
jgi:hypothetical protein